MPRMAKNGAIPRSKLLERTLELLHDRPDELTLIKIAAATGLTLDWLTYLGSKRYKEDAAAPSVDRVVVLYEYLTQTKLEVR